MIRKKFPHKSELRFWRRNVSFFYQTYSGWGSSKLQFGKQLKGRICKFQVRKVQKLRKFEQNDLYNFEGKFGEISQNPRKLKSFAET